MAGGPIQSITTLTKHLSQDFNFKIITTDRDFKSNTPYSDVEINKWTKFEGREVFYMSPENMNPEFILNLIQSCEYDVIYLNSLFSKLFTIYPLKWKKQKRIQKPIVLAPRGMLRDAALAVKPLKKQLFLLYAKLSGLFSNIHWQSTSAQETLEITKRIGNVKLLEVSNLPDVSDASLSITKTVGELRLCFIARIVDIKNLNFAIEVLKEIKQYTIIFDVYGPQEDVDYWQTCEANAKNLQANIHFKYCGSVPSQLIAKTISNYHALFLPTQTENFGHVIVQSLQCGRPVIISNNTPWQQLVIHKAGYDIDLHDKLKFIEAINTLVNLNQSQFNDLYISSKEYINSKLKINELKQLYIKLFNI